MILLQSIGIFGGSFDPVHNGHVLVARAALEELSLDRLFIVPAARSPFKPSNNRPPPMSGCGSCGWRSQVKTGANSTRRNWIATASRTPSTPWTNTRTAIPRPSCTIFIGADHVPTLPQWREAKRLAKLARFVVVPRPGQAVAEFPGTVWRPSRRKVGHSRVSSSTIRQRLALGQAIDGLVPPVVAESLKHSNPYL